MFSVYSTKPGGDNTKGWRWALSLEAEGLTRRQAAVVAKQIKQREGGFRAVVYGYGSWRYTV